ncbi:hypothetical protein [Phytohabitans houttuyneae]|uniref:Anaphase-promoting complex subunit 4 WD40 domain-containing protein n=1 Tax=Phytohabitans houttuyneae TaxID=1076126 RepID=A0A6V8KEE1_9ACTN|nr:hypothetical protein [Phytohabitans houttuyneae]GFJ82184.1 hypothetical protein Phou_063640 [Phytohabitans houttuyneae]
MTPFGSDLLLLGVWGGLTGAVRDLVAHEHAGRAITYLATSPDGRWLAVLSHRTQQTLFERGTEDDGLVRVYDPHTGHCLAETRTHESVPGPTGCRWSRDGTALYVYGHKGLHGYTWLPPA